MQGELVETSLKLTLKRMLYCEFGGSASLQIEIELPEVCHKCFNKWNACNVLTIHVIDTRIL